MILRLSQKLCTKFKAGSLKTMPLDENPFADWSAHLFFADRTQYIIVSNTKSLYSTVLFGKGITDDSQFIGRAMSSLREFMQDDGLQFIYQRFVAPASGTVLFAKALDRSVTGSMNDLVAHAKMWLVEYELSPYDVGFKLMTAFQSGGAGEVSRRSNLAAHKRASLEVGKMEALASISPNFTERPRSAIRHGVLERGSSAGPDERVEPARCL